MKNQEKKVISGSTNRKKGHSAERFYAQKFREVFPQCQTSRYASRMLDDGGVDLANIPLLVQIKAGVHKGIKYQDVLKNIEDKLPHLTKEFPKALIHHKQVGKGKKRDEYSSLVILTFDDFFNLIKQVYDNQEHNSGNK
jgi:hypothetical protein